MYVDRIAPTNNGPQIVLRRPNSDQAMTISIGFSEAHAIRLRLEDRRFERPLTHDLLDAALKSLGGRVRSVEVSVNDEGTFIGLVVVRRGRKIVRLDSRASDAIALALGSGAPIYVSKQALAKVGRSGESLYPPLPAPPVDTRDARFWNPPQGVQTL